MLQEEIFKAYDIRGVWGHDWDAAGAADIARALIEVLGVKRLVVGWDMRVSSPEILAAVERAARTADVELVCVGQVTTPALYFAVANYPGNDAGVMITASHNTGEWNGLKITRGDGQPVGEDSGLGEIKKRALAGNFSERASGGTRQDKNVLSDYVARVLALSQLAYERPLRIVIDYGNGMGAATNRPLLAALPMIEVATMYAEPDGTFPHHEANPLKVETLQTLQQKVLAHGADLGVAFDGDADRIGFVDEKGQIVGGDVLTGIVVQELLKRFPGEKILYDLRSRRAVGRMITAAGGQPVFCRVGHAFIKQQLRATGALLAGELSSHFYFREFFGVECADLMLLYVLRAVQTSGRTLGELAQPFLADAHSGEINFIVTDRLAKLAELEKVFAPQAQRVSRLDGLLFDMGEWWFNVRPSNTEPILRLNLESAVPEKLSARLHEVTQVINS